MCGPAESELGQAGVVRWAVNTVEWAPGPVEWRLLLDQVSSEEQAQAMRFVRVEDRKRALVSRLMQRACVSRVLGVPFETVRLGRTREGKPYLVEPRSSFDLPCFNFNASHHGAYVVLASEPLCLVGVDVMTHEARPGAADKPAEAMFQSFAGCYTPAEWATVRSVGPDDGPLRDQFYRLWCLKEAYIKAVGIGLGFELRRAEFRYHGGPWAATAGVALDGRLHPHWRFAIDRLGTDHWVGVARGPPAEAIPSYRESLSPTGVTADAKQLEEALAAPSPPFQHLKVVSLLPPDLQNAVASAIKADGHATS